MENLETTIFQALMNYADEVKEQHQKELAKIKALHDVEVIQLRAELEELKKTRKRVTNTNVDGIE
jgi:hypothetical protein